MLYAILVFTDEFLNFPGWPILQSVGATCKSGSLYIKIGVNQGGMFKLEWRLKP